MSNGNSEKSKMPEGAIELKSFSKPVRTLIIIAFSAILITSICVVGYITRPGEELSEKDRNHIAKLLMTICDYNYDSSNPADSEIPLSLLLKPGMREECNSKFTLFNKSKKIVKADPESGTENTDGAESSEGRYYCRYDGEITDWLLRNVYNCEPEHIGWVHSVFSDSISYYYYAEGYYYKTDTYGEGHTINNAICFDCIDFDEGKYNIVFRYKYAGNDVSLYGNDPIITKYATVAKKSIDGEDFWSVIKVSDTPYFDCRYDSGKNSEWQKKYIEYIQQYEKENNADGDSLMTLYRLVYIDDDDIPELIIDSQVLATGMEVCTLSGGLFGYQVNSVTVGGGGCFLFRERENKILASYGHSDDYFDEVYTIENGKFVSVAKGNYGLENNAAYFEDDDPEKYYRYIWNGELVDASQYEALLNGVFNSSLTEDHYFDTWDAENMIDRLRNDFTKVYPVDIHFFIDEDHREYYEVD